MAKTIRNERTDERAELRRTLRLVGVSRRENGRRVRRVLYSDLCSDMSAVAWREHAAQTAPEPDDSYQCHGVQCNECSHDCPFGGVK